jgi:hypothetical protein
MGDDLHAVRSDPIPNRAVVAFGFEGLRSTADAIRIPGVPLSLSRTRKSFFAALLHPILLAIDVSRLRGDDWQSGAALKSRGPDWGSQRRASIPARTQSPRIQHE